MLIEKIILRNFRVYYGINELALSIDPEKNVSIISGQNGFGKTSFLTALVWCLYGKYMPDVDERYRKDINESGGYKKHVNKLMSSHALEEAKEEHAFLLKKLSSTENILEREGIQQIIDQLFSFNVTIKFTHILIPHLSCNNVEVSRTYNILKDKESIVVLIDGKVNELTKTIGQEIFINDFILPKEIAKFFFFDAEKITALAEVRNIEEKQYFSKAYNEVLGIKKYTDLKENIENLQLRIRKKSANKVDLKKIEDLQEKLKSDKSLLEHYSNDLERKEQELAFKRAAALVKQEELIRAGNKLSNQQLANFIDSRVRLKEDIQANRNLFNNLLELAPFAMLMKQMEKVKQQLIEEAKHQNINLINSLLKQKYLVLKTELKKLIKDEAVLDKILKNHLLKDSQKDLKSLLDFAPAQANQFHYVFENITDNYTKLFKENIAESRRLQSSYNIIQKNIQDAEVKANDAVIKLVKESYEILNQEIQHLEESVLKDQINRGVLEKEITTINRQLSEQTKHIKIEEADREKAKTSARLIKQLEQFINQLKRRKKSSLEKNIQRELNSLMHKQDFVNRVEVLIEGDLIDIELFNAQNQILNKETLSKGEQQLYATALLKALVTESHIQFPVFIDSPLQKLDRNHASNIIRDFYPTVSSQVVLFPLLEKELNEEEYQLLKPKVGKACLIEQKDTARSSFKEVQPLELFYQFNQTQKVNAV